jgi:C4-type Zn-finger protein
MILTKLHDLSRPRKYTVQIERFDESTKSFVKSNKVTVTVTE